MEILPLGDQKGEAAACDLYKGYFWEEILQTREGKKRRSWNRHIYTIGSYMLSVYVIGFPKISTFL